MADTTQCDTCDGTGKIRSGHVTCPDCDGTGNQPAQQNSGPLLEWRKAKAAQLGGGLERRMFPVADMELREQQDGMLHLSGYASITETPYEVGFYTETIQRGAFKRTLGESPDVQLLINHGEGGSGMPLARTRGGTLRLAEDDRGLKVDADLDPEDPDVQLLARKMKGKLIDQMSFAFQATSDAWNDEYTERTIKAASIHRGDVSVVNQGANAASTASIRSTEALQALRRLGPDVFVASFVEWRDWTLVPVEERAGKTLSNPTMEVLTKILSLVQASDDATDQAIPMLAELMGVENPDADDRSGGAAKAPVKPAAQPADPPAAGSQPDGSSRSMRERERLMALRSKR